MKKIPFIVLSCLCLLLVGCGSETKTPMSISWRIAKQDDKVVNVFTITNNDKQPIGNNWVLYYNQLPPVHKQDDNVGIKVEEISGTFYKMYPTANYVPIEKTVEVLLHTSNSKNQMSFFPEGAYLVFVDKAGRESTPVSVNIEIENSELLGFEDEGLHYPNAQRIYASNVKFQEATVLSNYDIIPSPKKVVEKDGIFLFTNTVNVEYDKELENEGLILQEKLSSIYGCNFSKEGKTKIVLRLASDVSLYVNNEHYQLEIGADEVVIIGVSSHAVFNGVQTLLSVLGGNALPLELHQASVSDYPDLLYRGQMVDVSRNFTSKENLLKLIDALALYKINKLHLHLTDDEGWRLEIAGLEELTTVGSRRGHTLDESEFLYPAYGSGWDVNNKNSLGNGYYTKQDFIDILKYAQSRHIAIIPEIDFPGHSRAAIKSMNARYRKYIEVDEAKAKEYLLTDFDDTSKYNSAQDYNDNVMNVALPSSYKFVEKVISELVQMYDDAGLRLTQIHLGGDEIPHGAWEGSPIAQKFMKEQNLASIQDLKDYFVIKTANFLKSKDIQMVGWQEFMLLANHEVNSKMKDYNILSYCWNTSAERGADEIPYRMANMGHPVVLSNVNNFYFDLAYNKGMQEQGHNWGGFVNEYISFDMLPYNIYKSVRISSDGKPLDIHAKGNSKQQLNKDAYKQILGVQGQLWAETIRSFDMTEYSLFPKLIGLAERGWHAKPIWQDDSDDIPYTKDLVKYNAKIVYKELPRLLRYGVNFRLAQPGISVNNNTLYMNNAKPDVEIRYTVDGSEPTVNSILWKEPIECSATLVKARAFYGGKESITTIYKK